MDASLEIPPVPDMISAPHSMAAQPVILRVAIDDGLAQMKLVGETPSGSIVTFKIPTAIRSASAGAVIDLSGDMVGMYRTEEGQSFVCSSETRAEETRFPDFHVSQQDRVLIHHALAEAGYGDDHVEILTALPVDEYFVAGQVNRGRIDLKVSNLLKGIVPVGRYEPGAWAEIVGVKVGCQGIAAFFDFTLNESGKPNGIGRPDSVAVIDIGGSTTDIAVIMKGTKIDGGSSGAARLGVLDVHAGVRAGLTKRFDFTPSLTPDAMNIAIRTGRVTLFREEHDVSEIVNAAVADIGNQIIREVERKIGNAATLDAVLFVGGGAGLFREVVGNWRGVTIPNDPEFANARGLLKYARSRG